MAVARLRYPPIDLDAVAAAITIDMCLVSTKTCMMCGASSSTSHNDNRTMQYLLINNTWSAVPPCASRSSIPIVLISDSSIATILLHIILLNLCDAISVYNLSRSGGCSRLLIDESILQDIKPRKPPSSPSNSAVSIDIPFWHARPITIRREEHSRVLSHYSHVHARKLSLFAALPRASGLLVALLPRSPSRISVEDSTRTCSSRDISSVLQDLCLRRTGRSVFYAFRLSLSVSLQDM